MVRPTGSRSGLTSNQSAKRLIISGADRVCLFGRTGSGKTTLARHLLGQVPRFVVLDAKGTFTMDGVRVLSSFRRSEERQIVRPRWGNNAAEVFDEAMVNAYRSGNIVVYLDETTMHTRASSLNPTLAMLIRLGRERGIGTWCASQRPKNIPSAVFTEAEHIISFPLNFRPDREKIESFTADGVADAISGLEGHDFVYYRVIDSELRHMPAIALKGKGRKNVNA